MNYQLRRMKRKTVGIYITKEGEIEVRAPRSVSEAEIDRLVQEKEAWITTHQTKMRERIQLQAMDRIRPGGTVIFLGRSYPAEPSQTRDISFNGTRFLLPDLPEAELRAALVDFYRKAAKALLPSAVERFAPLVGKAPQQVRITSAKTRWGSCSAKGGLNFSWRLLCAPPEAMDYVVVHELAHLIEFNHSSRFWAIVEGILPDYKARRQSLKEVQESLLRQGW